MINKHSKYVIGVDFGTDSARAIIVDVLDGNEVASSSAAYSRWAKGMYCDVTSNRFRQHPADYIEALESVIQICIKKAGDEVRENIIALSVATTGSTPVAVDEQGMPLALLDSFRENPNAMFILWKDHTAVEEAETINDAAQENNLDFLKYVGGSYSSEWYWAKMLHVLRHDAEVRRACYTWVEHSDWMPFLLTGGAHVQEMKRNVCAAGHKGLWAEEFGGMPPVDFFKQVDPVLVDFVPRFGDQVYTAAQSAGNLSSEWAERLGLSTNVLVGVGAIDAHLGAVGSGIRPHYMTKVMGTSTCDMMVVPREEMQGIFVKGISGQVDGSIIPGMIGLEAGQSAFGDIYSWFKHLLLWPLSEGIKEEIESGLLSHLSVEAAALPIGESSEFSLDWFNGRRTPDVNPNLKGLIGGLTLGSSPPAIYRALVEATCYGSRAIVDHMQHRGIRIEGVNATGGIAVKSEFVVQTLANILNREVEVVSVEQSVALGAAMFASVVGGIYDRVEQAIGNMGRQPTKTFYPEEKYVKHYEKGYEQYERYGRMVDYLSGSMVNK